MHLRQSTASQAVLIGPFVDTDGAAVTGLTIDAADIRLSKNGANIVGKNSGGGTHDELGMYTITLDATDTNTVGRLQLVVAETGALIVTHDYEVIEEAAYDMLYAASALGYIANAPVNMAQISGDSTAADNLELTFDDTAGAVPWQGIIDQGTMQAGSTGTTAVLRAGASFADDVMIGATIFVTGGTGIGQRRLVTDWVSATDTATVDAWVTTPDNTSTYKVFATAPSSGGSAPSAATVAAAVWDASQASHTTGGSFGEIATEIAAILVDTAEIGAAGAGLTNINLPNQTMDITGNITGNLSGSVGSVTGAVGSVTGAVGSVTGLTASDVGDIKAKTDSLTFTVANVLDVNALRINGTAVQGDGSAGNLWRG